MNDSDPAYNREPTVYIDQYGWSSDGNVYLCFHFSVAQSLTLRRGKVEGYNGCWDLREVRGKLPLSSVEAVIAYLNIYQKLLVLLDGQPNWDCLYHWWTWNQDTRWKLCNTPLPLLAAHLAGHKEYLTECSAWESFQQWEFGRAVNYVYEQHVRPDSSGSLATKHISR